MASSETDHHSDEMTQSDLAFTSAIKALMQIFLSSGVAQPKSFDVYMRPVMEAYAAQGDLKAAELLRSLLVFAHDPNQAAVREARRKLRDQPAAGSA